MEYSLNEFKLWRSWISFIPLIYNIAPKTLQRSRTKKQLKTISLSPIPKPTTNNLITLKPTKRPTFKSTQKPSLNPTTKIPSKYPTSKKPTPVPSYLPTNIPTYMPSVHESPTQMPTSKYRKVYNFQQFIEKI